MAEISLNEAFVTAETRYSGQGSYSITAGKNLNIETSPNGEEILSVECPAGKSWEVTITIGIVETDV